MKALRIARIRGIDVRVDLSALVIMGLIAWMVSMAVLPEIAPEYPLVAYWTVGIGAAALFFASLLAHEFGHSIVAQRQGIKVVDITLWLLGGVARIDGEPAQPHDDFAIAIAGPLTSLAAGATALFAAMVVATITQSELLVGALLWLGLMNLMLAVFNLIPAAPLDGGRVLRAWLWHRHGDPAQAARSAAKAGAVFGKILIGIGIVELFYGGGLSGVWSIVLGWFILSAARNEEVQREVRERLAGMTVLDLMTPDPITVGPGVNVAEFLDHYVLARHCSAFPVVDAAGDLIGLATLARARVVGLNRRMSTTVADIAWPMTNVTTAAPAEPLVDVLGRIEGGDGRVLVLDHGALVGIVSPTDISRLLLAGSPVPA